MKKLLLAFILLMGGTSLAQAACTMTPTSAVLSLGSPTSFAINTTPNTVTTTVMLDCGAGLVVLLGTDYVKVQLTAATFSANSTQAALGRGTDRIPLELCTDATCTKGIVTLNGPGNTLDKNTLLDLLGLLAGFKFPITLYIRTVPGAVVAAGNYTVTLSVLFTYDICTSISLLGGCLLNFKQTGAITVPVTLNMLVEKDCTTITAPGIDFGSAPLVNSFVKVSQSINVICTKDSVYSVGISNGEHAEGNQRYMTSGSSRLAYQIFKGSGTTYWGPNSGDRVASTLASAVSADGLTKTFNYNALILTNQQTPPAGSYKDTVTVDLSF